MLLSAVQMVYAYFVEGSTVFVGKRKVLAKRVSLTLRSLVPQGVTPLGSSTDRDRAPLNAIQNHPPKTFLVSHLPRPLIPPLLRLPSKRLLPPTALQTRRAIHQIRIRGEIADKEGEGGG